MVTLLRFGHFYLDNVLCFQTEQYLVFSLKIFTNVVLCLISIILGLWLTIHIG